MTTPHNGLPSPELPPARPKNNNIKIVVGIILVSMMACAAVAFAFLILDGQNHVMDNSRYIIPSQYYVGAPRKYTDKEGLGVLQQDVVGVAWLIPYEETVFDCSEMSAYMERYLENLGWHSEICVSQNWTGGSERVRGHAWVMVEFVPSGWSPVECTTPSVVWGDDPLYNDYFDREQRTFKTILQAMEASPTEFDWWNNIHP